MSAEADVAAAMRRREDVKALYRVAHRELTALISDFDCIASLHEVPGLREQVDAMMAAIPTVPWVR